VVKFPEAWEERLRAFDDLGIRWLQRPSGPLFLALALAITGCTTIELAFVVPVVLFVTGWDSLATEFTYLALTTALVSQIPKRFLWRSRPYVAGRAQTRRKDKTSSFPSRAVTCAVVYSFAVCFAVIDRSHPHTIQWWMPLVVLIAFLLASFARINLGVHYPSDCVGGILQGAAICAVGTLLWEVDVVACGSCSSDMCYSPEAGAITWHTLSRANWWVMGCLFVVMAGIVGICLAKPLDFWAKCDRVFGMLFPCVAFRVTFLCPAPLNDNASLTSPSWPPAWYSYLVGIGLAACLTVLGVANKGRYPFAAYLVFFFITFFSLSWWRLFVTS
jgi:membrane-associated phospholipid phosphatase